MALNTGWFGLSWFLLVCACSSGEYLNEWLVEIPGGLEVAQAVAKEYGFVIIKELPELPHVFQFRKADNATTNSTEILSIAKHKAGNATEEVLSFAEHEAGNATESRSRRSAYGFDGRRVRRVRRRSMRLEHDRRGIGGGVWLGAAWKEGETAWSHFACGAAAALGRYSAEPILSLQLQKVRWIEQQRILIRTKRDFQDEPKKFIIDDQDHVFPFFAPLSATSKPPQPDAEAFNDPLWNTQWYLIPPVFAGRSMRAIDSPEAVSLKVAPAWKAGYTGKGVVVTILDDGLETNHSDLAQNYDAKASYNINGNNRDPTPRYDRPQDTHHGTRCAGEVAMQANNSVCGVGVAYNAQIGGVRMLDGTVTDRVEAEAFSFNNNYIDIYSSSWGPSDNGKTVEKPGLMAARALEKGVTEGRKGKGSLYIWASGNGGINGDSCAYDGYASNVYTLSVGSTTEFGHIPIYAEQCPATMACTYSSGSYYEGKIISTDLFNQCTSSHTGTSASAPLAAGIIALLLEANPALTWRDVKHLVAWTSDPFPILRTPGWYVNGVGMLVHPVFGFGLMDSARLIEAAQIWPTAPLQRKCAVRKAGIENSIFKHERPSKISVTTKACKDTPNEIRFVEHVEVIVSLVHLRRGAVQIFLESPMGTVTLIAPQRAGDTSTNGLAEWPFVSVHTWGENPFGVWKVTFESHNNSSTILGAVNSLMIVFRGTYDEPSGTAALRELRRQQTSNALSDVTV